MFIQLAIGSFLMVVSVFVAGANFWLIEVVMMRGGHWLATEPHRMRLIQALLIGSLWILLQVVVGVWVWALTYRVLGIFSELEPAVYFSLTAFTTLGFGNILLPLEWRLLGGLEAVNGLLTFGMLTAVLIEALRQVRRTQIDSLTDKRRD